jgi:hypothetical protein
MPTKKQVHSESAPKIFVTSEGVKPKKLGTTLATQNRAEQRAKLWCKTRKTSKNQLHNVSGFLAKRANVKRVPAGRCQALCPARRPYVVIVL